MKPYFASLFVAGIVISLSVLQVEALPTNAPVVLERGMHHNKVQTISSRTNIYGTVALVTNHYTQLQSGLNFKGTNGVYQPTRAEFQITPDGVECNTASYLVQITPDTYRRSRNLQDSGRDHNEVASHWRGFL